jgi:hypothetical protein
MQLGKTQLGILQVFQNSIPEVTYRLCTSDKFWDRIPQFGSLKYRMVN